MSNKILVTDSLFIFDEHVKKLEDAGYEIERLDKPDATEEELCKAIKGKIGYILGGIEKVTDKVIQAADELKVIAFTGADYKGFIPGWKVAEKKEIAISDTPGANSFAVSEFALAVALMMQRNLLELGRTGEKAFETTGSFKGAIVGVIGAGNIGTKIISTVKALSPQKVVYFSRTKKECGAEYSSLEELVEASDIIFLTVPGTAGQIIDGQMVSRIKEGALVINIGELDLVDMKALFERLQGGSIRAAIDWNAPSEEFNNLSLGTWFNTNNHAAYNTHEANKTASDMAVQSLLNILKTGEDEHRVL